MSRDMKSELDYLKNVKTKEVREKINNARKFCDVNEDATYKDFIDEQYRIEAKINELETKLAKFSNSEHKNYGLLNHKIKIKWLTDDLEEIYCLVSPIEASLEKNYLSVESPLGKILVHAKIDKILEVDLPNGKEKVKVIEIEPVNN